MVDEVGTWPTATTGAVKIDRHFRRVADSETWRFWRVSGQPLLICDGEQNLTQAAAKQGGGKLCCRSSNVG